MRPLTAAEAPGAARATRGPRARRSKPHHAAAAAEWEFHDTMLAVKEQVIAQFGKNSDQVQALGLKKKAEYKSPVRTGKSKTV